MNESMIWMNKWINEWWWMNEWMNDDDDEW